MSGHLIETQHVRCTFDPFGGIIQANLIFLDYQPHENRPSICGSLPWSGRVVGVVSPCTSGHATKAHIWERRRLQRIREEKRTPQYKEKLNKLRWEGFNMKVK